MCASYPVGTFLSFRAPLTSSSSSTCTGTSISLNNVDNDEMGKEKERERREERKDEGRGSARRSVHFFTLENPRDCEGDRESMFII